MFQLFYRLFCRQYRLQRLDHGTAVIRTDPGSQSNHFVLHSGLFFRHSCDILDLLRSELTRFPQSHHVTLDETIAVAKRDHDTGSRLQSAPQTLRHPVLKGSIQFFVGDIYNDIRI